MVGEEKALIVEVVADNTAIAPNAAFNYHINVSVRGFPKLDIIFAPELTGEAHIAEIAVESTAIAPNAAFNYHMNVER
jgi:hypothetical protein